MVGPAATLREARVVPRGLRSCLEHELENLRRLLRYRGLERRFGDQLGPVDEAVREALDAGSRTLSLSALRTITALTTEVNREPSKRVASGDGNADRA